jgi:carbon monoxide dehydrogenase subunit G
MRPAALVALLLFAAGAFAATDQDIDVTVSVSGDVVRVDGSFAVAASLAQVWAVMTDFDGMARFISNLKSSRVVARTNDLLTVAQAGQAVYGPMRYPFESVREIRLWPMERVQSRLISGNMSRFEGSTRFVAEPSATRVVYHSEAVPKAWVPPIVGPRFIERETREQFAEFRAEILRRKAAAGE